MELIPIEIRVMRVSEILAVSESVVHVTLVGRERGPGGGNFEK